MKGILALVVFVSWMLAGCAGASHPPKQPAESPQPTRLSANHYPNTPTREDIVCGQPAAMLTSACQGYRYSDFGGMFK